MALRLYRVTSSAWLCAAGARLGQRRDYPDLLFQADDHLRVFYAPFDWENPGAKIILLGVSPGWTQFEAACQVKSEKLIIKFCRRQIQHLDLCCDLKAEGRVIERFDFHRCESAKTDMERYELHFHAARTNFFKQF